ncbi:MAG TPA: hypothetical protein VF832_10355 [Longimicrobiales bacterium]
MKLRLLGLLAVLLLAPAAARAQGNWPCCTPLNRGLVDRMQPLLQAEVASSKGLDSKLAAVAMTKQEYVAAKNSLMAAKLDAADGSRLSALPFDDGSRKRREANVAVYRANKARIDAALQGLQADPICGLCVAKPGGAATNRR